MITPLVPSGGLVTVVVLANDSDQNSVVVTVGLYGSITITEFLPSGGLVTVVVLANDSDQNSVVSHSWVVWFFDDHTVSTIRWVSNSGSTSK